MKRASFLFVTSAFFLLLGACKGETVSGIGGGGSGGTDTHTSGACKGDAAKWAEITAGPFACQKNSDCCVVTNGCLAQVQLVKATDYTAAQSAWPYCDDVCVGCITPSINVACVNGTCVGEEVDFEMFPELSMDHCGEDPVTVAAPSALTKFGCGAGD
jgi:hypothetical protein